MHSQIECLTFVQMTNLAISFISIAHGTPQWTERAHIILRLTINVLIELKKQPKKSKCDEKKMPKKEKENNWIAFDGLLSVLN